jgi:hypothetical protein
VEASEMENRLADVEQDLTQKNDHIVEEVDECYSNIKDYLESILEHCEANYEES